MYLVIDRTKVQPIQGVVEAGGCRVGTTQILGHDEIPAYAKWLGLVGGRDLLDAFEVRLINDGMLHVWPVDDDGDPLHDECEAQEIVRYDDGPRIVWQAKVPCITCSGEGHFADLGEPVDEEDLCAACDGDGYVWGSEFETAMDGAPVATTSPNERDPK